MKLFVAILFLLLPIYGHFTSIKTINCNFEQGDTCSWFDPNNSSWILTNSTSIDPGHDHTCSLKYGQKCGTWLSTVPSNKFTGTQEFTLISSVPILKPQKGTVSSISFSYHFFGLEVAEFSLQQNSQRATFNAKTIFAKRSPQSNGWADACVSVDTTLGAYLMFHAVLSSKYQDTFGLDDISTNPFPCELTKECDFESAACTSIFNLNGIKVVNGTPIVNDHTTGTSNGHYLYAVNPNKVSTATTTLGSLIHFYNNQYDSCLKFWFFIDYNTVAKETGSYIEVVLNYTSSSRHLKKKLSIVEAYSDNLLNKWRPFFFSISHTSQLNPSYKLTLALFSNSDTRIGVDDVSLDGTMCPEPGYCDFEQDFCGWSNVLNNLWLRSTGNSKSSMKKSPSTDTTTKEGTGWFAIVPAEFLSKSTALLLSPPITRSTSTSVCFSFNYFAVTPTSTTPVLLVKFEDLTKTGKDITSMIVNGSTVSGWNSWHVHLEKMPSKFSISIRTVGSGFLKSDLAIDDLSLSLAPCNHDIEVTTVATPVPANERKFNCNFESSCKQWTFDPTWKVTNFRSVSSDIDAPRRDHTLSLPEGKYLLWMPKGSANESSNSTEVYSTINSTVYSSRQHCFSFWYYDSSEIFFQLQVLVGSKSNPNLNSKHIRNVNSGISARSWKLVEVDLFIYATQNFIQLQFNATSRLNGAFSLDDLTLTPGACPHGDGFVYTFDGFLDNLEINYVEPSVSRTGSLYTPKFKIFSNAPKVDHTSGNQDGGYFLFMNKQMDYPTLYVSQLVIPYLKPTTTSSCLTFAYQLYGNASLSVYQNRITTNSMENHLFTSDAYHSTWVIIQLQYESTYEHKIVFQMQKQFDLHSYVALDDVSLKNEHCESSINCDFDDDTCSYSQVDEDYGPAGVTWSRFVGPPDNFNWPGPPFDQTTRTYGGGYIFMTGYPETFKKQRVSTLQTPIRYITPATGDHCLTFWTQITDFDGQLIINLTEYKFNLSHSFEVIWLSDLRESKWTQHYFTVKRDEIKGIREFNLFITGATIKPTTVIALDGISYREMSCPFLYNKLHCLDSQTPLAPSRFCDFRKNCNDGSDEKDCSEDCTFENNDVCGWLNETGNYGAEWLLVSAKQSLATGGPNVDGSGSSSGHYLLLKPKNPLNYISSYRLSRNYELYRVQYKNSYYTCSMTFDYYVHSEQQFPKVQLEVHAGYTMDSAVAKFFVMNSVPAWRKATVQIGAYFDSFNVFFTGSSQTINETVAVDNVRFQNCSLPSGIPSKAHCSSGQILCNSTRICIEKSDLCDFQDECGDQEDESFKNCMLMDAKLPMCAFEKSLEECGISQQQSDAKYLSWFLFKGYDSNLQNYFAPAADHTTDDHQGQFLTIDSPGKEKNFGKAARLYTHMVTSTSTSCALRFFYFNNGNSLVVHRNLLRVYAEHADGNIEDSGYLFTSNNYQAAWKKATVLYNSKTPFRFVIEATFKEIAGSISIDDMTFSTSCRASSAKPTPPTKSPALAIVLSILGVLLLSGIVFFVYKMHQSGRLSMKFFTNNRDSRIQSKINERVEYVNNK